MSVPRITSQYQNAQFIKQMFEQQNALANLRAQIASGYKVSRPSEAPGTAGTIVQFQQVLSRMKSHQDRMSYAENMLDQQETIISNAKDVMLRAKEIANQASNEVYSVEQRRQLAEEIWSLRDAIVNAGNTKVLGRYIYGGADDDDPPFDLNPNGPYANPTGASVPANRRYEFDYEFGSTTLRTVRITDDEIVSINSNGANLFQPAIDALERLGRALEGYRTVPEVTTATPTLGGIAFNFPAEYHDQTGAITNALDQITASMNTLTAEESSIGARLNRISQAKELLATVFQTTEENRADLQDADIYSVSSQLSMMQTSFQALLASGSQINRLSLLDYI